MKRSSTRSGAAAMPLALFLLVVGCASEPASLEGIAVDDREGSGGPDAALEGTLLLDDGCFYVDTPDSGRWVVSFPRGAVERVGDGIKFDRTTYNVGDQMIIRGQDVKPEDIEAPPTCSLTQVWMAFSKDA